MHLAASSSGQPFAGTAGGGVFESTDDGSSWTAQNSGLTDLNIGALSCSADGYLYCASYQHLFRSAQPLALNGAIAGRVAVGGQGLPGVTMQLLQTTGEPVANQDAVTTGSDGTYEIPNIPAGPYQIMAVEPLGYAADQNPKPVTVMPNTTSTADFSLSYTVLSDRAEKWSYWKNQFDKVVKGKKTEETPEDLASYIATIQAHYTPHFSLYPFTSFQEWQEVLSKPAHPTNRDDALAEVAALVLNIGSLKLGQYTPITEDGRTAGEVLTYVSTLIANPSATDIELGLANDLAERANHGDNQKIKAGEVPVGAVLYKGSVKSVDWGFDTPNSYALYNNYPNPFNPTTTIQYDLPKAAHVSLKVYDCLGKVVASLANGEESAGRHLIQFDASNLASGVYVCRLQAQGFVATKRLLLLK
jgi:hypothetical protein